MATKNTYARKKSGSLKAALKPAASAPEDPAPVAAGIQSLFSLVSMMRTMNAEPTGSPLNPKVILSASGVEVRFAGPDGTVESIPAEMQSSPDQMLRIERTLEALGMRLSKVEQKEQPAGSEALVNRLEQELRELREKLAAQSDALEALRASVQQNEQMMETLVDSMNMVEDLGDGGLGQELVIPPDTLAS